MNTSEHTFSDPRSADAGGTSRPGGSEAAARLLEMTARETAQWRSDAEGEAAAIVAAAREEAASIVRGASEEAGRLAASARDEAAQVVNDARIEAYRVREETAAVRKRHDTEVARLQQVATQHRERMRQHLNEVLDQVNSITGDDGQ
jgi:cell division septum initiation protein DivIVA